MECKHAYRKAQSAMEYMTTYGWALLLIAVVAVLLYFYIAVPSTIVPSRCAFIIGANCNDMVFGTSSSHATELGLFLSNNQPYALLNPTLIASINGRNYTFANDCKPTYISAGGEMICILPLPISSSLNQFFTGSFYLTANYCGLAANTSSESSCSSAPSQVYKGAFTAHAEPLISPSYNVTLSVENSTNPADGARDILTAKAYMLGYPVAGADVGFYANFTNGTSAVPPYVINPANSTTGTSGVAQSVIYGYKAALVNVTADYFGKTATKQIAFTAVTSSAFAVCTNNMMHSGNPIIVINGKPYTCSQITNSPPLFSCNSTNPYTFAKYLYVSPGIRAVFNYVDINGVKYPSPSGTITVYNCTKPIVIANYTNQYEFNGYANPTYNYSVNGGEINASPLSGAVPYNLTVTPSGTTTYYHYQAWFDAGSQIKISEQANAAPAPGWVFNSWTCGINTYNSSATCYSGTTGTETISMHGAINETANFWANLQMLVYPSQPNQLSTGGATAPSGITSYPYGTAVQITATNNPGFEFHEWQGTNPNSYTGTANPTTIDMYNPIIENAIFYPGLIMAVYPSTPNQYSTGGTTLPSPGTYYYYPYGTSVPISETSYDGFIFNNWACATAYTNGCNSGYSGTSGTTATLTLYAPITETANFYVNITVNSPHESFGSTTPSYGIHHYPYGTSIALSGIGYSTPSPGYTFHNWTCASILSNGCSSGSGSYSGTSSSVTIYANAPYSETAHFWVNLQMSAYPPPAGSLSPSAGITPYRYGSNVPINVTLVNPGYKAESWTCTGTNCYSGPIQTLETSQCSSTGCTTSYFNYGLCPYASCQPGYGHGSCPTGSKSTVCYIYSEYECSNGYECAPYINPVITMDNPISETANFYVALKMVVNPSSSPASTNPGVGVEYLKPGTSLPISVSPGDGWQLIDWSANHCFGSTCYSPSSDAGTTYSGTSLSYSDIVINYYPITETANLAPYYLYTFGGYCSNNNPASCEEYSATASHQGQILQLSGTTGAPVAGWAGTPDYPKDIAQPGCAFSNTNIWCYGGYTGTGELGSSGSPYSTITYNISEYYNSSVNNQYQWRMTGNPPGTGNSYPIPVAADSCVFTNLFGGMNVCIGGYTTSCSYSCTATHAVYVTPASDNPVFHRVADYPKDIAGESCVYDPSLNASNDGTIFCIDGYSGTSKPETHWVYMTSVWDILQGISGWARVANYGNAPTGSSINGLASPSCMYDSGNGDIICIGGYTGGGVEFTPGGGYFTSSTNFIFVANAAKLYGSTPSSPNGAWTSGGDYPTDIADAACSIGEPNNNGGFIYCTGGYVGTGETESPNLYYADASCIVSGGSNCWSSGPNYPTYVTGDTSAIVETTPWTYQTYGYKGDKSCSSISYTCTGVLNNEQGWSATNFFTGACEFVVCDPGAWGNYSVS